MLAGMNGLRNQAGFDRLCNAGGLGLAIALQPKETRENIHC